MVQQNILHLGSLPFNIHIFVAMLFVAAVLGDSTGYAFGHKVGRKLFDRPNSKFFKKKYLVQAENFYEKHGALTIVLARIRASHTHVCPNCRWNEQNALPHFSAV